MEYVYEADTAADRDGNDTINAQYRVDPARNAGATFAFDEVVRDKCTRQHLEAEDCECCRNVRVYNLCFLIIALGIELNAYSTMMRCPPTQIAQVNLYGVRHRKRRLSGVEPNPITSSRLRGMTMELSRRIIRNRYRNIVNAG